MQPQRTMRLCRIQWPIIQYIIFIIHNIFKPLVGGNIAGSSCKWSSSKPRLVTGKPARNGPPAVSNQRPGGRSFPVIARSRLLATKQPHDRFAHATGLLRRHRTVPRNDRARRGCGFWSLVCILPYQGKFGNGSPAARPPRDQIFSNWPRTKSRARATSSSVRCSTAR